ncbi:MAG: hypothetical protein ABFD75_02040 [Smithella sp.]
MNKKHVRKRLSAKERNTHLMLQYLSDPNNQFISRAQMVTEVLGYRNASAIYNHFTPTELHEIEREALDIRRRKYAPQLAEVDIALLKTAKEGNPAAAKLVYQRFEGWSEKTRVESNETKPMVVIHSRLTNFPPEPKTMEEWEALVKGQRKQKENE